MGANRSISSDQRLIIAIVVSLLASLFAIGSNPPAALAAPGVSVTPTTLDITEDGAGTPSATYDVVLTEAPSGTVTIALNIGGSSEFTVDQASLEFTTGNWMTPQTVTVDAVDDDIDDGDSAGAITHSATGGGYGSVVIDSVTVNVEDDDTAGATINSITNFVEETGTVLIDTYNVALTTEPTGVVTFTMTVDPTDGIDVTAVAQTGGAGFLTFTPLNWNVPQTVLITSIDDDIEEPQVDIETILHTTTGGGYDGVMIMSGIVNVWDTDDAGVTIDELGGVSATEGGPDGSYSIVLDTEPTEDVTIDLSPQGSEATATATAGGGTSLTFTSSNWSTPQFVTVTADDDDVDDGDTTETIDHTASSADGFYDGFTIASVTSDVLDDDVAGVTVSPLTVSVTEGGATDTYDVVLDTEPTASVTVTVTPQGGEATAGPSPLTFTTGDWDSPQTVTVTAVDDSDLDGATTETFDHAASGGGYDAVVIDSVTANVADDDTPGIIITGTPVVTEPSGTDTYVVSLTTAPSGGDVSVAISESSGEFSILSPSSPLVFNGGNWDTGITVTVQATNDDIVDGQQTGTITHDPSGGGYDGVSNVDVTVTVNDDDVRGIAIVQSSGNTVVTEGGATDSYTVALTSQPSGPVTVTLGTTTGEAMISDASLNFTTGNWSVGQTITVTAVNDDIDDGATSEFITHAASGADYNGITGATVTATVNDNDTRGITVTESTDTAVTEGGATDTYRVELDSEPTSTVNVAIASTTGEASVDQSVLTFTASDWDMPQTVTVTAVDDDVVDGPTTETFTHTAAGGDYDGLSGPDVAVDVTDDDVAGVIIEESDGSTIVSEGSLTDTYTVVLASEPTEEVRVTATPDAQVGVAPSSVIFTALNWDTPQEIEVSGVEDNINEPDPHPGVITHSTSSDDTAYDGLSVTSVTADVADADALVIDVDGPSFGAPGLASEFTATVLSGGVGTVSLSWTVMFGGSQVGTGSGATFAFTPTEGGAHTVMLVASDDNGSLPAISMELVVLGDIEGNTFVEDIVWLAEEGITRGCNPPLNDEFCPNDPVTREQMASFLVRFLGLTDDGGGNNFVDDDGSIHEADIAKLAAAGITVGCNPPDNDEFCPTDPVTREQMAAFIVRALGLTDDGGGNSFVDDDGSIFEADIAKLAAAGITVGCNPPDNDEFCPTDPVTRGQMAAFIRRSNAILNP